MLSMNGGAGPILSARRGAARAAAQFFALAHKNTDQSAFDTQAVTLESEVTDTQGVHSTTAETSRFTIPAAWSGRYVRIQGNCHADASVDGGILAMWRNGTDFQGLGRFDFFNTTGDDAANVMSAPVKAETGQYFELQGTSNIGSFLNSNATWGQIELLPTTFAGALVYKTATQALSAGVAAYVDFEDEIYDHLGFHSTAADISQMKVPGGVKLVRVSYGLRCGNVTGQMLGAVHKNGSHAYGLPQADTDSSGFDCLCGMSAPITVVAGDYFQVSAFHATATDVAADAMVWGAIEVLPPDLKYAIVTRSSDQAISAGTTTTVLWNAESVDTDGWHSTSTDTSRLTVPAGVNRVRVGFNLQTGTSVTGQLVGQILKNGATFIGTARAETDTAGTDNVSGWSAIVDVVPGDYFEVTVFTTSATTITSSTASWFAIEEVRTPS